MFFSFKLKLFLALSTSLKGIGCLLVCRDFGAYGCGLSFISLLRKSVLALLET